MIFFCVRKWFYSLWDHLAVSLSFNIAYTVLLVLPGILYAIRPVGQPLIDLVITGIGMLPFFVLCSAGSRIARDFSESNQFTLSSIRGYFLKGAIPCLRYGLVVASVAIAIVVALPYYLSSRSIESFPLFVMTAGGAFFFTLTLQYALPLHVLYEPKISRVLWKSFRFFMDNTGFTLGVALGSVVIIAVSVATLTIFPGFIGLLLWHHTCFSVRMLKYEYLESHPDASRNAIPWNEILAIERGKLAHRTLKGTIFPWMD